MHLEAQALLDQRTSHAHEWEPMALLAAKNDQAVTITVILPALNEEATVGAIVRTITSTLGPRSGCPLVDELVVLDSGSTDKTAEQAARAGATVIHRDEVLPHIPSVTGKGEAMWRGLSATTGDLVVFVDADLLSFNASYITGLLGPLLNDDKTALVKAVYERPLVRDDHVAVAGGGRVTELVARPLLNLYWQELAGVIQPLSGEYAARRTLLESLSFPTGYGVDFALLVDTAVMLGVRAISQVDLGVRVHRHHDDRRLGRMAAEIMQTAMTRLDPMGALQTGSELSATLIQFAAEGERYTHQSHEIAGTQRPPIASLLGVS